MKKMLLITLSIIAVVIVAIALYYNNTRYYFDFDEVVYYSIEIDEDVVFSSMIGYEEEKYKTERDSIVTEIIIEDGPYGLTDASFENNMKEIGFKSKSLSDSKLAEFKEIFREKLSIPYDVSCMPVYRDIYVFKKNGKISGIAKLCYDCEMSHFIGTNANTGNFGADGEFGKLNELVK